VEAVTVFSFRRRPFRLDRYHVLEGMSIYILNHDEKKNERRGKDVPFYIYER
jgi:hypothetical protein